MASYARTVRQAVAQRCWQVEQRNMSPCGISTFNVSRDAHFGQSGHWRRGYGAGSSVNRDWIDVMSASDRRRMEFRWILMRIASALRRALYSWSSWHRANNAVSADLSNRTEPVGSPMCPSTNSSVKQRAIELPAGNVIRKNGTLHRRTEQRPGNAESQPSDLFEARTDQERQSRAGWQTSVKLKLEPHPRDMTALRREERPAECHVHVEASQRQTPIVHRPSTLAAPCTSRDHRRRSSQRRSAPVA